MGQVVETPDRHCYLTEVLGYDYEVKYKLGKDNKAADALSCLRTPPKAHY